MHTSFVNILTVKVVEEINFLNKTGRRSWAKTRLYFSFPSFKSSEMVKDLKFTRYMGIEFQYLRVSSVYERLLLCLRIDVQATREAIFKQM